MAFRVKQSTKYNDKNHCFAVKKKMRFSRSAIKLTNFCYKLSGISIIFPAIQFPYSLDESEKSKQIFCFHFFCSRFTNESILITILANWNMEVFFFGKKSLGYWWEIKAFKGVWESHDTTCLVTEWFERNFFRRR